MPGYSVVWFIWRGGGGGAVGSGRNLFVFTAMFRPESNLRLSSCCELRSDKLTFSQLSPHWRSGHHYPRTPCPQYAPHKTTIFKTYSQNGAAPQCIKHNNIYSLGGLTQTQPPALHVGVARCISTLSRPKEIHLQTHTHTHTPTYKLGVHTQKNHTHTEKNHRHTQTCQRTSLSTHPEEPWTEHTHTHIIRSDAALWARAVQLQLLQRGGGSGY
ncbi:unnamed protein product [Gadus morhua 'NCC']